jgi:hypothetical protein
MLPLENPKTRSVPISRERRHRRVHRIHGRERAAHRHDNRHKDSDIFDGRRRCRLGGVVFFLRDRVHVQPLVVVDVVGERLGRYRVSGAHQGRTQHFDALQVADT